MTETSFSANQQRLCFLAARLEHTYIHTNIYTVEEKEPKESKNKER